MKFSFVFLRYVFRLNLPLGLLLVVLQRVPALRMSAGTGSCVLALRAGELLRAAFTTAALGTVHSLAGATAYIQSPASPVRGTVGRLLSVAGESGSIISSAATLSILNGADFGRLVNLSILTNVSATDPLFTLGTVIGGAGTGGSKPLLVRAAGPALAQLGVAGALADPKLDVFSGPAITSTNDDWGGTVALTNAFNQIGAFAYASPGSKDAASFNPTTAAGAYTIQVSGVGGATGLVIAELYDASPAGAVSAGTLRLVNVLSP
jgi:hypothetical protein